MALIGAWTTICNLKAFKQLETNPVTQLQMSGKIVIKPRQCIIKIKSHIMSIVHVQSVAPVHFRVAKYHHRIEESPFLEAEKPPMGSPQLMRKGMLHRPSIRLIVECNIGISPGQEVMVLKIKGRLGIFGVSRSSPRFSGPSQFLA